ncbi:hypothetical protein B2I93_13875 [Salmonella enterica]|nr:hypothetical protein [Salmonella enterica]ECJ5196811.1 hypothetical protein [Salmonella enterica subsp. enterica]
MTQIVRFLYPVVKPVGGSLSALKDGVPASVVELNRMGFGHMRILACIGQLPESGLMHYGSVGFFFGTDGALRLLAKKPDGAFVTYDM